MRVSYHISMVSLGSDGEPLPPWWRAVFQQSRGYKPEIVTVEVQSMRDESEPLVILCLHQQRRIAMVRIHIPYIHDWAGNQAQYIE